MWLLENGFVGPAQVFYRTHARDNWFPESYDPKYYELQLGRTT